jgi:predicted dehydrogenase
VIRIGVVGYGYWGPNLARNFSENGCCVLAAICDPKPKRQDLARRRHPGVNVSASPKELIDLVDAVAIATPVESHFEIGMAALQAGRHVLIEKPLTSTAAQAECLIEEAEKRGLVLMVDHTFLYTGAVKKIKQLLDAGELGDCRYYDSVRVNLGLFQPDVNVIWDLAVHDLSIMDYLLPGSPVAVSATGISPLAGCAHSIAYMTCFFEREQIAHIHVNWLSPMKIRRTLLGCSQRMVVYDDVEPSEKVKVYDKGVVVSNDPDNVYRKLIEYRMGDMWAPKLDSREALGVEAAEFLQCIENRATPLSNGQTGLRVVRLLEAATQSMLDRGRPVEMEAKRTFDDSLRGLASAVSRYQSGDSVGHSERPEYQPVRSGH